MLQHALPLTVLQYRRDSLLASRARSLMTARPSEPHTAPALASALNVSVRTLHRQLEEEGTSLQALKDAVRREQAIEQLCRTTQPIKQIALSLGFASEKTFARAFRQWTGESPSGVSAEVQRLDTVKQVWLRAMLKTFTGNDERRRIRRRPVDLASRQRADARRRPSVQTEGTSTEVGDLEQTTRHHHVLEKVNHLVLVGEVVMEEYRRG